MLAWINQARQVERMCNETLKDSGTSVVFVIPSKCLVLLDFWSSHCHFGWRVILI